MTLWRILVFVLTFVPRLATAGPAHQLHYLPELPGTTRSQAVAINERGQIVGWCYADGKCHAMLWDESGAHDIGSLPGYAHAQATDINNRGQVVGNCGTHPSYYHDEAGFVWDKNSGMQQIPTPAGCRLVRAAAINDAGQVTLYGGGLAYRWSDREGIVLLEPLPGPNGTYNTVSDINNAGTVVGTMVLMIHGWPSDCPCLWRRDGTGVLLSTHCGYYRAGAIVTAINNQGTCVGFAYSMVYIFYRPTAAIWNAHPNRPPLTKASHFPYSAACDINDCGEVAGYVQKEYSLGPGTKCAAFWDRSGSVTVFGPGSALALNNAGVMVGEAGRYQWHAAVWR